VFASVYVLVCVYLGQNLLVLTHSPFIFHQYVQVDNASIIFSFEVHSVVKSRRALLTNFDMIMSRFHVYIFMFTFSCLHFHVYILCLHFMLNMRCHPAPDFKLIFQTN
jgi:hypothetical protein